MSIIHVNQISQKIKELFNNKLDLSDLPEKDQERDIKILTRCLAAYSIYHLTGSLIEDAASSVTDGQDDNGIDAIYYSSTLKQLIIVQSKWNKSGSGQPNYSEISKFCQGIRDLFNLSFDRFNSKLKAKQTVIEHALGEYDTRYILVLIDIGNKNLTDQSQRLINDLLNEMNHAGDGITDKTDKLVSFQRLNQAKIHSSLAQNIESTPITLEMGLSQWGKVNQPHSAFFGMVSGEEVAKWWEKYGRKLFDQNIRQVLGNTDVNKEIRNTLLESPEKFWYFNNGITIVAD